MSGLPVLRPEGEIDIAAVARLRPVWLEVAGSSCPVVVVDLSAVTFMDVAGVGLLVALRNQQRQHGGVVQLRSVPRQVGRLLELTGLVPLFPVERHQQPAPVDIVDIVDLRGLGSRHEVSDR